MSTDVALSPDEPEPTTYDQLLDRLKLTEEACDIWEVAHQALYNRWQILGTVLLKHFPMLECDHDGKRDRVVCGCSLVDLGWHPSIGEAQRSWVEHVTTEKLNEEAEA